MEEGHSPSRKLLSIAWRRIPQLAQWLRLHPPDRIEPAGPISIPVSVVACRHLPGNSREIARARNDGVAMHVSAALSTTSHRTEIMNKGYRLLGISIVASTLFTTMLDDAHRSSSKASMFKEAEATLQSEASDRPVIAPLDRAAPASDPIQKAT